MNKLEIDSLAFDEISLHDVDVYGFFLRRQGFEISLILDIDYLVEGDRLPATLTFLDVVDLQIHLDWGVSLRREEPYGVIQDFSGQVTIYDFQRFTYTDPVYIEGSYLRYELDFSVPQGGRICLGAKDFTIIGRAAPDSDQRPPLILGG